MPSGTSSALQTSGLYNTWESRGPRNLVHVVASTPQTQAEPLVAGDIPDLPNSSLSFFCTSPKSQAPLSVSGWTSLLFVVYQQPAFNHGVTSCNVPVSQAQKNITSASGMQGDLASPLSTQSLVFKPDILCPPSEAQNDTSPRQDLEKGG